MEHKNKKIVMFDFDGVLIDTLLACYSINQEINENLSLEEYKSFFDGNIYTAIRPNGQNKKLHAEWVQMYETRTREIKIPDSLKLVLKELSGEYLLSIVSSTDSLSIKKILERENCSEYFQDILGADVHTSKVHKIQMLLEKYQIAPDETVFITDTVGDVLEAEKCSVKSIAVAWGFEYSQTLEKCNPTVIIDDPKDLVNAVHKILND